MTKQEFDQKIEELNSEFKDSMTREEFEYLDHRINLVVDEYRKEAHAKQNKIMDEANHIAMVIAG